MTPEEEIGRLQRRIDGFNAAINNMTSQRREAEKRVFELRNFRDAGIAHVILAARHLDPEEGGLHVGGPVMPADISALRTVLRFVSAHKDCGKERDDEADYPG